jgi:CNT family concentrative nucleoside transporter
MIGFHWEQLSRGLLGLLFLIGVCYVLSNNKKAINWKLVLMGMIAQVAFAIGVLSQGKYNFFRMFIQWISDQFVALINIAHKGIEFMFGNLADTSGSWGYTFAIQALPNIIFFAALSSLFYYLGILQKVVYFFAVLLSKLKISGAESTSTAANIFLGQTEAPLMVRPFLEKMTRSEVLCIMVGGMANTAGSVLAAYVGFLSNGDPSQQHYFALHLLSQSIMSAPAAVVCSKILFPQTEMVDNNIVLPKEKFGNNMLDAISLGTSDGLKLAVSVGAILIVFTGLVYMLNYIMGTIGYYTGLNNVIAGVSDGRYNTLSFQMLLGYIFSPVAWLIGVKMDDMISVGQLLGEKTIINEFQAFISFSKMKTDGIITDSQSILITTYSLCGFANFASIGIQIGGISQIAPSQRKNLTELGIKALIGGTIACLMCGCIAGAVG